MHTPRSNCISREADRKLFRELKMRTGMAIERHAQAAMAKANDNIARAAPIFSQRLSEDAAFAADMERMEPLIQQLSAQFDNMMIVGPKPRMPKKRKTNAKKI
jgi:hypothetical protein